MRGQDAAVFGHDDADRLVAPLGEQHEQDAGECGRPPAPEQRGETGSEECSDDLDMTGVIG